ncbi:MAG: CsbD family protein [Acidimicrobiales bacterium]
MAGEKDKVKGRAKQAAGDLTGDDQMRREGQADETGGDVKDLIGKAADKLNETVDKIRGNDNR